MIEEGKTSMYTALTEIQRLAALHNMTVSIITVDDLLCLKGIENATDEQIEKITGSWEWRHYGDNWGEWFENMEV